MRASQIALLALLGVVAFAAVATAEDTETASASRYYKTSHKKSHGHGDDDGPGFSACAGPYLTVVNTVPADTAIANSSWPEDLAAEDSFIYDVTSCSSPSNPDPKATLKVGGRGDIECELLGDYRKVLFNGLDGIYENDATIGGSVYAFAVVVAPPVGTCRVVSRSYCCVPIPATHKYGGKYGKYAKAGGHKKEGHKEEEATEAPKEEATEGEYVKEAGVRVAVAGKRPGNGN